MSDESPDRPRHERVSSVLFRALAPRVPRVPPPEPPERLRPYETVTLPRPGRESAGTLEATWYSASRGSEPGAAPRRGGVLLLHPWLEWGRAYFHRRGRIEALRGAGYHVLAPDLPGFGGSGEARGFYDLDAEDALAELARRVPGGPLHVWGVSSGGYWLHPAVARWNQVARARSDRPPILAAVFEEVSPHLLEWSRRVSPWGRPFQLLFRTFFPEAERFLDLRRHAPRLGVGAVAYVSGDRDRGIVPSDTRELARLAGGRALIVPRAGHLEGIKVARSSILDLALATLEAAEDVGAQSM